ncbi:MAG: hypothetical protein ABIZ04_09310 [Opitutus sp.]
MRKICLFLGLVMLPVAVLGVDWRPVIIREARKCAAAWEREDAAAIVSFMPARVIQQMGGRAALITEMKDQFAQARSLGAQRLEASVGQPTMPRILGRMLACIVPVTAVLHGRHLDLTQQTHVLAISADQGKRWSFVLLYETTQAELNAWFPEFRGKVSVPASPRPRMELAY